MFMSLLVVQVHRMLQLLCCHVPLYLFETCIIIHNIRLLLNDICVTEHFTHVALRCTTLTLPLAYIDLQLDGPTTTLHSRMQNRMRIKC